MHYLLERIHREIEKSDNVKLCDEDILSYGSNRICYLYKSSPSQLIKTARHPELWEKDHTQSYSEWYVSKKISAKAIDCHVSLCRRWVKTNRGPGLVVDRVVDDKGQSVTLRALLFKREITVEKALDLIEEIVIQFSNLGIPASDFNIDNFIIEGCHLNNRLIMVDGFSPKKINLKARLLLKSKMLANHYTKLKWRRSKSRFTYCAQKVYAGDYIYAAAKPLHGTSYGNR